METRVTPEQNDIQGYVFSGYKHLRFPYFVFLHFNDDSDPKAWLKEIVELTTTARPYPVLGIVDGKKVRDKPRTTINVAFAYPALQAFRMPDETLQSFPEEYVVGMAKRSEILRDTGPNDPETWQFGGHNTKAVHALLLLYAQTPIEREELLAEQRIILNVHKIEELCTEEGARPECSKEMFGFHDGVGQPAVEGIGDSADEEPNNTIRLGEVVLGYPDGYDLYGPSPNVPAVNDPHGILPAFPEGKLPKCRDFGRNGSFLVYRKLEQDVAGFWNFIQEKAGPDSHEMLEMGAKFFGRWPSGTPLVLSPHRDDPRYSETDEFAYTELDLDGRRCPIGAHIRRSNPRDSLQNDSPSESYLTTSRHRLVRRGIIYGEPLFPLTMTNHQAPIDLKDDGKPRGLHFIALNASTQRQFEFVQQTWCNDSEFHGLIDTSDPIVGGNDGKGIMTIEATPFRKRIHDMPRFVTVRAGVYFFMPGMAAMKYMASK